jgi:hypothetical protein
MILGGVAVNKHGMISLLVDQNVEALTDPTGEGWWEGMKIKVVDCKCSNGKEGISLRCKKDGNLEDCTATQQGSSACYKSPSLMNQTLSLLCESGWTEITK